MAHDWVVVGIGNPYLQDDRAGVAVIEELEKMGAECQLEVVYTVGFEVMDKIKGFKRAIIVDACKLGNRPGEVLELSIEDIFSSHNLANSHAITLGSTLQTGRVCFPDEMPVEIRILLIEVKDISGFTQQMSAEVEEGVRCVVARIWEMLHQPAEGKIV